MKKIFIFFLLLLTATAYGKMFESTQVTLEAVAESQEISIEDTVTLEVTLTFQGRKTPTLTPPRFKGFELLSKRSERTLEKRDDEKVFVFKYFFVLFPQKAGELTIGPFFAAGCKTSPITVKVNPAVDVLGRELPSFPQSETYPFSP